MELLKEYKTPIGCFNKILLDEERSLRLVVTGECNLSCEFCAYKVKDFYSPEVHSSAMIEMRPTKELRTVLIRLKGLGYNIVHLTGGEPTLAENIIEIAKLAKDAGFSINLCSNLIDIKPILLLLEKGLLNELTFSYLPLDLNSEREDLPSYKRPDKARINRILKKVLYLKKKFPNLTIKTNIIINPFTDINRLAKFIQWCWKNNIIPRVQRDRSSQRISKSTMKTLSLLKSLSFKPEKIIIKIPGATEICEFKSSQGKLYIKVFNKNFRLVKICRFCHKKNNCQKSLSNIRIYDSKNGPILSFCNIIHKDFTQLTIDRFFRNKISKEVGEYKKDKLLYFNKFCARPNFQ